MGRSATNCLIAVKFPRSSSSGISNPCTCSFMFTSCGGSPVAADATEVAEAALAELVDPAVRCLSFSTVALSRLTNSLRL